MDVDIDEIISIIERDIRDGEKTMNELRIYLRELRELSKEKKKITNELSLLNHSTDIRKNVIKKLN